MSAEDETVAGDEVEETKETVQASEDGASEAVKAKLAEIATLLKTQAKHGDDETEAMLKEIYAVAQELSPPRPAGEEGDGTENKTAETAESPEEPDEPAADGASGPPPTSLPPASTWNAVGFQVHRDGPSDVKAQLEQIYGEHNPSRVANVEHLLENVYKGRELLLLSAVEAKYLGVSGGRGGLLGLQSLVYALKQAPDTCKALLEGPFPFAAAAINLALVAARLCGAVDPDDASPPFDPLADAGGGTRPMLARCAKLLESSDDLDGFYEIHVALLKALERAAVDSKATSPMDFLGCAAAAKDEVAVLLAHGSAETIDALKTLVAQVPTRASGFLVATTLPKPTSKFWLAGTPGRPTLRRKKQKKAPKSATTYYFTLSTAAIRWFEDDDAYASSVAKKGPGKKEVTKGVKSGTPPDAALLANRAGIAGGLSPEAGAFKLDPGMTVKFIPKKSSFTLFAGLDDKKGVFSAVARDAKDLERWCAALTEHVGFSSATTGADDDEKEALSVEDLGGVTYKVVDSVGIYIRKTPDLAGARTGKALMAGDTVTAIERRRFADDKAGPDGRAFLRVLLPGDEANSGWVIEHHPTTGQPILDLMDDVFDVVVDF